MSRDYLDLKKVLTPSEKAEGICRATDSGEDPGMGNAHRTRATRKGV